MRHVFTIALATAMVAACGDADEVNAPRLAPESAQADQAHRFGPAASATYYVTVTNLTAGQPFTPPLAATHRKPLEMFEVGDPASFGLKEIAENGNLAPMTERLEGEHHVAEVVTGAGPVMPGQSLSFEIETERGAKYLSWVSMLICTNDGFTGSDGLRLPGAVGEAAMVYQDGYDAGTEINTEDFADMVPPCPVLTGVESDDAGTGTSDPALAENDVIRHHPGILGIDDLDPAIHGWTDPVVSVRVERTH